MVAWSAGVRRGGKNGRMKRPAGITGPVIAVALVGMAAGYGQFGAVAALGQVATAFGAPVHAHSVAAEAGLSGLALGLGLAILRLASAAGQPLAAAGDRFGRRRTLIGWSLAGLALSVAAAASPSYWWFVAIFAIGRPFLSASAALTHVVTAELSAPAVRARALSLVAAGYGVGAGINALTHSALRGVAGFRILFLTCAIPFVVVLLLSSRIPEPVRLIGSSVEERPRFGWVSHGDSSRLLKMMAVIFAISATSAPASSFVFVYAENVVHLAKGAESGMILAAALTGFAGLMLGRRAADRFGRRPAIAGGAAALGCSSALLYSGGRTAVVLGYLAAVLSTGFLAPAGTAFPSELFGTSVRASVAGWGIVASVVGAVVGLLGFGLIADRTGSFEGAALFTAVPALLSVLLVARLPETRGVDLDGTLGSGA